MHARGWLQAPGPGNYHSIYIKICDYSYTTTAIPWHIPLFNFLHVASKNTHFILSNNLRAKTLDTLLQNLETALAGGLGQMSLVKWLPDVSTQSRVFISGDASPQSLSMKLYEPPPSSSGPLAPKPPTVLGEPSVGNHCIHI